MLRKIVILLLINLSVLNAYFINQNDMKSKNIALKNFDLDLGDISKYASKQKILSQYEIKYFFKTLKKGHGYVPLLSSMLNQNNIPKIFLYLAMAESNFSPNAISKKNATGLWQFMPATARKFGLSVDEYIDERKDPIKSTKAAIKYLKYLHKEFGKWYLVAMAYNCGEGRVRRSIRKAKSDNLEILLDEKEKYLPFQTRDYIKKIIAIASILSDKNFILQNSNGYLLNQGTNHLFDKVKVLSGTNLENVARSIGVSLKKIKALNPQFNYAFVPLDRKSYDVYLPYGRKKEFEFNFKPSKRFEGFYVHEVKKGDSLWAISKKYRTKYKFIKKMNNLKSNHLRLKQKLIIPLLEKKPTTYIVKQGDTLGAISKQFGVKLAQIKQMNSFAKYIKPGDKIVIPTK